MAVEEGDIVAKVNASGHTQAWIGGNDRSTEATWVWEADQSTFPPTTEPTHSYSNWAPGQPNNQNGEDCMVINLTPCTGVSCSWTEQWACPPDVGTVGTAGNDGNVSQGTYEPVALA